MKSVVEEFEQVTKYPLAEYLLKYQSFLIDSYSEINKYYSGEIESIDNSHLKVLSELTTQSNEVLNQFENFANKFATCGYWELMEYLDGLNNVLEQTNLLPKFRRTTLTKRGYVPYVQVNASVGGLRTVEDIAQSVNKLNSENTSWVDIMLNNDFNEDDWEIDQLKPIELYVETSQTAVSTVLDSPIGERVYGIDINCFITIEDNDLQLKTHKENIDQKCRILLNLNRGDVPEYPNLGKDPLFIGGNVKQFGYPEIVDDIRNNFIQNDLFEYASVTNFGFDNGAMTMDVEIKTKYDYKTEMTVTI